ncbi:MAG: hypothetical protein EOO03_03045 [Chitinophagaceae bacterium]|nr:MAG: hypothetical protein EOO03_03045 [Chitinophagaceae bacterium]
MKRFTQALLGTIFLLGTVNAAAQSKVVKTTQKANDKARQVKEDSDEVVRQAGEIGNNINTIKSNVKSVISIFEPILRFRLKKKNNNTTASQDVNAAATGTTETATTTTTGNTPAETASNADASYVTQTDINNAVAITTESSAYNSDGSANLGIQNNTKYGCYLDMVKGQVMDDIDAAGQSKNIDLIFTATGTFNEQVPMYAFLTPAYAKDDGAAYHFFKGTKFKDRNIPPATWDEVNESEVAMTALTAGQFEKIQNNNQLMAVVKQVKGFSQKVESRTKLDGKVLAVKTEMGDRTTYGLICISNHYGTIGSNGYLKIKIKVTGFDSNGDGNPDASIYSNY